MSSRTTSLRCALLVCAIIIAALFAATASAVTTDDPDAEYTPTTLPGAQILDRQLIQGDLLTGLSKDVPGVCSGRPEGGVSSVFLDRVPGRVGVGTAPAQLESSKLEPGQNYHYCLNVTNRGEDTATFELTTIEYVGSPDPAENRLIRVQPTALGTWLHPVRTSVTVPAGGSYEVPYAIDIPADAPKGTLTAGIRITAAEAEGSATASVMSSVVHNIYITLPGGTAKQLRVDDVEAPRVLSKRKGDLSYRAKFTLINEGTVLDSYTARLKVKGLRRTVADDKSGPGALLPNQGQRVELRWGDLPWIGWYKPEITVQTRQGDIKVDVPRVLILPPKIYVIAFLLALLIPIAWIIWAWYRRRQAWMAYYAAELEREDDDEADHDDHVDEYWDPTQRH